MINMGALDMGIKENELAGLVRGWRESNPNIVKFWYSIDRAFRAVIITKQPSRVKNILLYHDKGYVLIKLPSGRVLTYANPRIVQNERGMDTIAFDGVAMNKKYGEIVTFSGKIVENIVQAVARDLLANSMMNVTNAGYKIVMHVHDEIVCEVNKDIKVSEVCNIMDIKPEWATDLPLRSDGFECLYYKKD
jgi:DNA polymerase